MRARTLAAISALALLLPAPGLAETVPVYVGVSGLSLVDLSPVLSDEAADPPATIALPGGVALVEKSAGNYSLTGLPDSSPGGGESYSLVLTYGAESWTARWPVQTRTPSELAGTPLVVQLIGGAGERAMVAGDTAPPVEVQVIGLSADPSGATAVWELFAWDGTVLSTAGTTTVTPAALENGTWAVTLTYEWAAADTSALSGDRVWGRFQLTLPGGDVLTRPADPRQIIRRIYP